jgi:hypothetical protein
MKNSSLPFSRKLVLACTLLLAAGLAFVSPWGVLAALSVAALVLFWPTNSSAGELGKIDALLRQVGSGQLVDRLPHTMADPTMEAIRVNLNSALDQTETAFR